MTNRTDTINKLIKKLISKHEGGEEFFTALDEEVRSISYMEEIILNAEPFFVGENLENTVLIVSGKFGIALQLYVSAYKHISMPFGTIIVLPGNLRNEDLDIQHDEYLKDLYSSRYTSFIILDDSFYSGKTVDKLIKFGEDILGLKYLGSSVVYDGNKTKREDILSLYRYYNNNEFLEKTNFNNLKLENE